MVTSAPRSSGNFRARGGRRVQGWGGGSTAAPPSSPSAWAILQTPAPAQHSPFLPESLRSMSACCHVRNLILERLFLSHFAFDTNQTQLHFMGCEGRAAHIRPSSTPSPKPCCSGVGGLALFVWDTFCCACRDLLHRHAPVQDPLVVLQKPCMEVMGEGAKLLHEVALGLLRCCLLSPGVRQALNVWDAASSLCCIILRADTQFPEEQCSPQSPRRYLFPPLLIPITPKPLSEATVSAHSFSSYSR